MLKRIALSLALLLGEGRARAEEFRTPGPPGVLSGTSPSSSQEGNFHSAPGNYQAMVVAGAVPGAALGYLTSHVLDGDTGWKWSKTDTALELVFVGVTLLDMMQTSEFRSRGHEEANSLLGTYPSQQEVTLGIGACILGHALVAIALPKPWRSLWQGGGIGVEVMAVVWNRTTGVGFKIPW